MKNISLIFMLAFLSAFLNHAMEAPPSKKTNTQLLALKPSLLEKEILGNACLINQQDETGKTLLANAIEQQKEAHAELLVNAGANPFKADINRESAFHATAKVGNVRILRLLAKYYGDDPRWEAMLEEHNEALDKTLEGKTPVQSPLAWAQRLGHKPCAFIFKNIHKYKSQFSRALVLGDIQAIKTIITIDPHIVNSLLTPNCKPLCFAVLLEDSLLTKLLLDNGAIDTGDYLTHTMVKLIPTPIRKMFNQYKIKIKYSPGLKRFRTKHDPQMALSNGVLEHNPESIANALEQGAKINELDIKGNTALHWACTIGNPDIIAHLLKLGANPNLIDRKKKRTGLAWLLRMHKNSVEKNGKQITTSELLPCFFLLICCGADANIKDAEGKDIFTRLHHLGFTEIELGLINRILKAKGSSKEERKKLLRDIHTYQVNEKDKWRKDDPRFDLRNVYDVENARVKMTTKDGKAIFKEIYKNYIE